MRLLEVPISQQGNLLDFKRVGGGMLLQSTDAKNVGRALYENALDGLSPADRETMAAHLRLIRDNLNSMTTQQKESA